jgi:hypothetical protein
LSCDIPAFDAYHMISLPSLGDGTAGHSYKDRSSSKSSLTVFACMIHAIGSFLMHLEVSYAG